MAAAAAARGVTILGAGAIGCLFGYHLSRARVPITLLLRDSARVDELRTKHGGRVSIQHPDGARDAFTPAAAEALDAAPAASSSSSTAAPPIANLLVATKAHHALSALSRVRHRLSADSVVVLLCNGVLGVHDEVARAFAAHRQQQQTDALAFVLGSTTHGAYRRGAFDVVHAGYGACVFGPPLLPSDAGDHHRHAGRDDLLALLGSLSPLLRVDATLSARALHEQLALKLAVNCCVNALAALTHTTNGGLLNNAPAAAVWDGVARECVAALRGRLPRGVVGDGDDERAAAATLVAHVRRVVEATAANYNSMLQDVVAADGASTEVAYLNGYVAAAAARAGVAAPWNTALATLIAARVAAAPETRTHERLVP